MHSRSGAGLVVSVGMVTAWLVPMVTASGCGTVVIMFASGQLLLWHGASVLISCKCGRCKALAIA